MSRDIYFVGWCDNFRGVAFRDNPFETQGMKYYWWIGWLAATKYRENELKYEHSSKAN